MNIRSEIKVGKLQSIFPNDRLHAEIARLLVLYEDLKIEQQGILNEISALSETNDRTYVHRYFLRRSISTLHECGDCMVSLNKLPEFQSIIKAKFKEEAVRVWEKAIGLLSDKNAKWVISDVRNDVGGHFGIGPAKRAISSLQADTIGRIEFRRDLETLIKTLLNAILLGRLLPGPF